MVVIEEFFEVLVFQGDAAGIVGQDAALFLRLKAVKQLHGGFPLGLAGSRLEKPDRFTVQQFTVGKP